MSKDVFLNPNNLTSNKPLFIILRNHLSNDLTGMIEREITLVVESAKKHLMPINQERKKKGEQKR